MNTEVTYIHNYITSYKNKLPVLVGSLRNKEQLPINLKGKFYHTKCSNINLAEHNIKFVALAQSKKQFADAYRRNLLCQEFKSPSEVVILQHRR